MGELWWINSSPGRKLDDSIGIEGFLDFLNVIWLIKFDFLNKFYF